MGVRVPPLELEVVRSSGSERDCNPRERGSTPRRTSKGPVDYWLGWRPLTAQERDRYPPGSLTRLRLGWPRTPAFHADDTGSNPVGETETSARSEVVSRSAWDRETASSNLAAQTNGVPGCGSVEERSLGVGEVAGSIPVSPTLRSLDAVPAQCGRTKRAPGCSAAAARSVRDGKVVSSILTTPTSFLCV